MINDRRNTPAKTTSMIARAISAWGIFRKKGILFWRAVRGSNKFLIILKENAKTLYVKVSGKRVKNPVIKSDEPRSNDRLMEAFNVLNIIGFSFFIQNSVLMKEVIWCVPILCPPDYYTQ